MIETPINGGNTMNDRIDIRGLDRVALFDALFNASKQQGMGLLNPVRAKEVTAEEGARIYADYAAQPFSIADVSVVYCRGRVMKIRFYNEYMDARGYERDNGEGAAAAVVDSLRQHQATWDD